MKNHPGALHQSLRLLLLALAAACAGGGQPARRAPMAIHPSHAPGR